jgi:hypothetical protein
MYDQAFVYYEKKNVTNHPPAAIKRNCLLVYITTFIVKHTAILSSNVVHIPTSSSHLTMFLFTCNEKKRKRKKMVVCASGSYKRFSTTRRSIHHSSSSLHIRRHYFLCYFFFFFSLSSAYII